MKNIHKKTVKSFGDEWVQFDQSEFKIKKLIKSLEAIFLYFP